MPSYSKLRQQLDKLQAQLAAAEAKEKLLRRKQDTCAKIILGGCRAFHFTKGDGRRVDALAFGMISNELDRRIR